MGNFIFFSIIVYIKLNDTRIKKKGKKREGRYGPWQK